MLAPLDVRSWFHTVPYDLQSWSRNSGPVLADTLGTDDRIITDRTLRLGHVHMSWRSFPKNVSCPQQLLRYRVPGILVQRPLVPLRDINLSLTTSLGKLSLRRYCQHSTTPRLLCISIPSLLESRWMSNQGTNYYRLNSSRPHRNLSGTCLWPHFCYKSDVAFA